MNSYSKYHQPIFDQIALIRRFFGINIFFFFFYNIHANILSVLKNIKLYTNLPAQLEGAKMVVTERKSK